MTVTKEIHGAVGLDEAFSMPYPHHHVGDFECDCGRELRATLYTECGRCGAHYERDDENEQMIQTVPPICEC